MARVICNMTDCVHRSKRPLRKWKYNSGAKCYGCTLEAVSVNKVFDPDGDIEAVAGIENTACCGQYEPGQTVIPDFESPEEYE